MSLKCSIFGHSFEESTVEREREEQGSEVVITIREVQTCTRCGETRVVSENKEVTTLETPDDVGMVPEESADDGVDSAGDPDAAVESDPEAAVESESDADVTAADDADPEPAAEGSPPSQSETGEGPPSPSTSEESSPPQSETEERSSSAGSDGTTPEASEEPPVTDDAEILEDDPETPDREPGQWPQEADENGSEPTGEVGPDLGAIEEAESDVDESKTDAEFIDESDESDAQPQTNEWPSEEEIDAASEPDAGGPGAVTVPGGSYVCRECGFSTPVEESSLREGDFCPECHRGTLVHVEGQ
ncbi:DUF7093 family protein [Halapricum hydrolyticum]|uniref:Uncharacterized protein n=1 Tax=Halapricum hydrolyticum TaxID=2979991 RepID=A0AAE3ICF6_9EURY|nr:hypothetical protein [Halapricum hydrolyticum]MCU4718470.1 hypothetical protein [Halapricum hydrolyticum]MCU4727511.1 hypothetical protein [Halapricum hydrolyticum]